MAMASTSPLLLVHRDLDEKHSFKEIMFFMATASILVGGLIAVILFVVALFLVSSTIHSQDPGHFYITSTNVLPYRNSTSLTFDLAIYSPNPADYYHRVRAYVNEDSISIPSTEDLVFEEMAPPIHPHGSNITLAAALLEIDDPEVTARITGGDRVDIILLVEKAKSRSWMRYYWRSNDDQVVALCPNVLFIDVYKSGTSSRHRYKCRVV